VVSDSRTAFGAGFYECLALVPDTIQGQFRRVAHACFWGEEKFKFRQATLEEAHADMIEICRGLDKEFAADDVPHDLVESVSEDMLYTITLV